MVAAVVVQLLSTLVAAAEAPHTLLFSRTQRAQMELVGPRHRERWFQGILPAWLRGQLYKDLVATDL
jgi:hypothetical protein